MSTTPFHRLAALIDKEYPDQPNPNDRRLVFLHGKIAALQKHRAELEAEIEALNVRQSELMHKGRNLWQDKIYSAIVHRKSRIPILIQRVKDDISTLRNDIARHVTVH